MEKKILLLNAEPDLEMSCIRPASWSDEYGTSPLRPAAGELIPTIRVPMLGRPNDPHRALYRTLTFALTKTRPDLIHAEEEPDSLATLQIALARRLFAPGAKLIFHTWQNVNRVKRWYVHKVIQVTLSQPDAILCANQEAVKVLKEMCFRNIAAVIPPQGVDTQIFQPCSIRTSPEPFTVLFIGRFAPEKGLDTLLEAMRLLEKHFRLRLIGDGPLRSNLAAQALASGLADRFELHPPVAIEKMPAQLASADVLVLPSRSTPVWKEQFGRVLVEAMACGVAVIGSDCGAIPEVIGDAGMVFKEGDAADLAECLKRLEASAQLRREMRERGIARVHKYYSQEVVAARTAEFYRTLMGTPPVPRP